MTPDAPISVAGVDKAAMRALVRARIHAMPSDARTRADDAICRQLSKLVSDLNIDFVLGYLGLPDEVRIDAFLAGMVEAGRATLIPRTKAGHLCYGRWQPSRELSRDEKGVLAPDVAAEERLPSGSGLVVVPGRAFDAKGGRLGRGGGHYDRLLSVLAGNTTAAGVAYECQVVQNVPREEHDRDVAIIVTESNCRRVR